MIKILLQFVLPLAMPTLLFLLWSWMNRNRQENNGLQAIEERKKPWFWLFVAGFVLMLIGLAVAAVTGGMEPGGQYQAPYAQDGKIVPGGMIKKP